MNKVIKKIGAIGLGAIMAGATLAAGALAATKLSDFPGFLGQPGTDFWIVVGKDAAASDVVGAVDIAARLAELSTTEKSVPSVTTTNVEGKSMELAFGDTFPRDEFKQTQVPALWDGKITYDNDDYRTYEEILVNGILKNDPSQFNGTTYVELTNDKPIEYVYVFADHFNKALSVEKPLTISLLGQQYEITNYTDSSLTLLNGVVGIAKADYPVEYEGYKFYAVDAPSNGDWVEVQVKDADGNVVADTIINKGEVQDLTIGGKTIQVKPLEIWASDISQRVSAKLVVGDEVEKKITEGTGEDNVFPEGNWYLVDVGVDTDNAIKNITIAYIPEEDSGKMIKLGEKISAPNDYFEVGYSGNMVNNFAQLTFEPVKGVTIYDNNDNKVGEDFFGVKITSDNNVFGPTNDYDTAYILLNDTHATIAYDEDGKAVLDSSFDFKSYESDDVPVPVDARYDDTSITISTTIVGGTSSPHGLNGISLDVEGDSNSIVMNFVNDTSGKVYLGSTAAKGERDDVKYGDSGIAYEEYKQVVTDYGAVIENPYDNAENDKVVVKIPSEQQKGIVYVGKLASTTTEGGTYKEYVPITTAVAKLDTEVNTASLDHNLVVVGGPCANKVAAELMGVTYKQWPECAAGIDQDTAIIKIFDNAFNSGKVAVLVAGYSAENTRAAASILQQYDTKLKDINASEVIVRGTEASTATIEPVSQ